MGRYTHLDFEFVDDIPQILPAAGTIYISIPRRTTAHLCLCGCGEKVAHPLRPNRWSIQYDGETISMSPSVGNSGLACKSHYWIKRSRVEWRPPLTDREISLGLSRDEWRSRPQSASDAGNSPADQVEPPLWRRLVRHILNR